jgi:hypothetical protein
MAFSPVNHIALTVRDLEVSAPWYRALIGDDPLHDEHTDGGFHQVVWRLSSDTLISVHQHDRSTDGQRFSEFRVGPDHVGSGARIAPNSRRGRKGWRNSGSNTVASSTRATGQA